jgi:hypothetical protein
MEVRIYFLYLEFRSGGEIGTHYAIFHLTQLRDFGTLVSSFTPIVAIAFFLIADIDSPRSGIIRVAPQNLIALVESLRGH